MGGTERERERERERGGERERRRGRERERERMQEEDEEDDAAVLMAAYRGGDGGQKQQQQQEQQEQQEQEQQQEEQPESQGADQSPQDGGEASGSASGATTEENPLVKVLCEEMGFSRVRVERALVIGRCVDADGAVNWLMEHEGDPRIDEEPSEEEYVAYAMATKAGQGKPKKNRTPEELAEERRKLEEKIRANKVRKAEEERVLEREREKARIESGKAMLAAKRLQEEQDLKRNYEARQREKAEAEKERIRLRKLLDQDRAERGLPPLAQVREEKAAEAKRAVRPADPKPVAAAAKKTLSADEISAAGERMKGAIARMGSAASPVVQTCVKTLLVYVSNVVNNPGEEKFRRIKLANKAFLERVACVPGARDFLEACGFRADAGGEFLELGDRYDWMLMNLGRMELDDFSRPTALP